MTRLVWFITGCSSGFGRSFVMQILERGDLVIATACTLKSIRDLEKAGVKILQLNQAITEYRTIDVVVNNAGYAKVRQQFKTNVFRAFKVTKAFLPYFRERRSGHLVFFSSLVGWHAYEFGGAYAGSKFALKGMVKKILDYKPTSRALFNMLDKLDGKQPGDPEKGVSAILGFVRGEGSTAGREIPFRLRLGTDAYEGIAKKCKETLALLKQNQDIIYSTDIL
ncbi:hypothetical protein J3F83DRAFT_766173 [Trichoderma novae-zelandiae]